ncbi:hypothetical protein [Streptomyces nitrosporeus]|uniref:hypothetical protein n=1 Tax=Streptomyces nitrosporeus TaxID=28894 RepID=UPI0039A33B69
MDNHDEEYLQFSIVRLRFRESVRDSPMPEFLDVPGRAIGGIYQSLDFLESVKIGTHGDFVKFGTTGLFGSILWDPRNGSVVQSGKNMTHAAMVNTSLERFSLCVHGVIDRYPFEADEGGDGWGAAARDVEDFLIRSDPESYAIEGNLWYEVRWDIENGDFDH